MTKSCLYYTDNELDPLIMRVCQEQLRKSFDGEIISVSLKPIDFGRNIILKNEKRGIVTMLRQILLGLEASKSDIVFFTEHDCLYSKSHFDFTPERNDIFYYNTNVFRWRYPQDLLITYDHLKSLSGLCVNRELAIKHYKRRLEIIEKNGWQLKYGFEPATKKRRRGGVTDEECEEWKSNYPNIDIRHKGTLTPYKCHLNSFKHKPFNWKEIKISEVPDWDLKKLFNL